MGIDYVYWSAVAILGPVVAYVQSRSGGRISRTCLLGLALVLTGVLLGMGSAASWGRLFELLAFSSKWAGLIEYRIIALGYSLMLAAMLLFVMRLLRNRGMPSNNAFKSGRADKRRAA